MTERLSVSLRDVIDRYIGGGWGKDSESETHPSPAFVIRGTDFSAVSLGGRGSVPLRFHSPSNLKSRRLQDGDIIFEVSGGSRDQPVGRSLLITDQVLGRFDSEVMCASFCKMIRPNHDVVDSSFLFYFLQAIYADRTISQFQVQSTGIINFQFEAFLDEQHIDLPSMEFQRCIGQVLADFDELIENNSRRIEILEEIAQAIYREWFVEFRYPGHEDVPLVDSELGPIPEGWVVRNLGQVAKNFDRLRRPLSSLERATMQGPFPYYGAAKVFDYVNDFLFDGTYVLVAEDGSVIDAGGFPVLQYVSGRFWANNHTHVLQGSEVSTEYLYLLLSSTNVSGLVTGAAQPKINQGNLNRITVLVLNRPEYSGGSPAWERGWNHGQQAIRTGEVSV